MLIDAGGSLVGILYSHALCTVKVYMRATIPIGGCCVSAEISVLAVINEAIVLQLAFSIQNVFREQMQRAYCSLISNVCIPDSAWAHTGKRETV